MGKLSRDQRIFQAGKSAATLDDMGTRFYFDRVRKIESAAAAAREDQQILNGSRRASGAAAPLDPEAPTRVRVVQPFMINGRAVEVGSEVAIALHLAQSLAAIGRCEIV